MAEIDVNDLASVGVIQDIPGYQLPPEAFTTGLNIRIENDAIVRGPAWTQVFGALSGAPYFAMGVRDIAGVFYYLYASLTSVYATDQSNHASVSGPSSPYAPAHGADWNGTFFGGIPVLTDGNKPPQYWPAVALATPLSDIPAWTSDLGAGAFCKAIRAFGPQLVAISPYIPGTGNLVHGILWSHSADPGTMPTSWAYGDPTKDAGLTQLPDGEAGPLVDAQMLRGIMMLYKQGSTWTMRRVGGEFIFQFDPFLVTSGILTPRCVCLTGDGKYHFVVTQDDVIVHDGNTARSVIDKRNKKYFFSALDSIAYYTTFVFAHPSKKEMWICYPSSGSTVPNKALVWNYGSGGENGIWYEQDCPFQCAVQGDLAGASETWDADTDTWDTTTDTWDTSIPRQMLVGDPAVSKIFNLDSGTQRNGVDFTGTIQRLGLSIPPNRRVPVGAGRRESGAPLVDWSSRKFIKRIWPKVQEGSVNIRLGFTDMINGATTWQAAQSFDPTNKMFLDFAFSGRGAPAIEFTVEQGSPKIYGYKIELDYSGRF